MKNRARLLAAIAMGVLVAGNVGAGLSQMPLTRSNSSIYPNLMFTLDDSGSMEFECLPDSNCHVPDVVAGAVAWYPAGGYWDCCRSVATYDSRKLFARRIRSAGTNSLYYNPEMRYRPWLNADGSRFPEYSETAAPLDPQNPATKVNLVATQTVTAFWCADLTAACAVARMKASAETFWPAQYYQLAPGAFGKNLTDYTQVLISSSNNRYAKSANRQDCAGDTCTYKEEIQNFSNWFTYARNRLKVAIGGTSEAFASVSPGFRVGYGTINSPATTVDGVVTRTVLRGVRPFGGDGRNDFYRLLQNSKPLGGTPLRRALDDVGQYFSRADTQSPWAKDPVAGQLPSEHLGCRRAYHILMTDGVWNGDAASTAAAAEDVDGTEGPWITHEDKTTKWQYTPIAPYVGTGGSTLADVAMYYWNRDLRPDLPNNVPHSTTHPAFWQHLVNYTLAFGVKGNLRNPEDLPTLASAWGMPASDAELPNVDDLWHAAVNSRGSAKSAVNTIEYASAVKSMLEDIDARSGNDAGVAVSGRSYSPTTYKYVPSYKAGDWTGDIEALALSDGKRAWLASEQLPPDPADRKIYTLNQEDAKGVPFTSAAMSAATQKLLGVDEPGKLIGYVRGDRTEEAKSYRKRVALLGDIVNSSPVLVKDLVDSQYDFLSTSTPGQGSYLRFVDSKKYRSAQLFAGANDGMLHAFNAGSGKEIFAFVPRTVLGGLKALADLAYAHRYFVDGPLAEVDVYDRKDTRWRNLVVGGGGAGAKNLFAINVPVPSLPEKGAPTALSDAASAPGAGDILWEINSSADDLKDLGNVLQAPEAGILRDGTWVIVTGNGYDSADGKAKLYLIDARTGARVAVLDTGAGSTAAPNGLGGVELMRDGAKRIVAAYAGDLYGNLWKFDLSSSKRADWGVAFGGNPLFKATNGKSEPEPITAAPSVTRHPLGGLMVLAGSGKLFEKEDADSQSERTLYGVWDKVVVGASSGKADDRVANNDLLVTQAITSLNIGGTSGSYFAISSNGVDYGAGDDAKKRGWKIRMGIAKGQRLIYAPKLHSGRVIFDTMVPGGTATGCTASVPSGYIFVLDPFTGAPGRDGPTFDTNGDGHITTADNATAAITSYSSVGDKAIVGMPGSGSSSQVRIEGVGAGKLVQLGKTPIGRQWRQIASPPPY